MRCAGRLRLILALNQKRQPRIARRVKLQIRIARRLTLQRKVHRDSGLFGNIAKLKLHFLCFIVGL